MNLIKLIMKNSTCYKGTTTGKPVGILWHDTGAGNKTLKRYVQPHERYDKENYNELINLIGKNVYKNDWNHQYRAAGVNAFIGTLADGSVATIQTLEWNQQPWGCGGSCNGTGRKDSPFWIQFEICDDYASGMPNDPNYFKKVYQEAVELTAYLCKLYNIDPLGTVDFQGKKIPTIICHKDSYNYGLGSNHGDVYLWFGKQGKPKNMDWVRKDVVAAMGKDYIQEVPKTDNTINSDSLFKVGQTFELVSNAKYTSGKNVASFVYSRTLYIREILSNGNIVFSIYPTGAVTGTISPSMIKGYSDNKKEEQEVVAPKEPEKKEELTVGQIIELVDNAKYYNGKSIPNWVLKSTLYLRQIRSDGNIVFSIKKTGAVTGVINPSMIRGYSEEDTDNLEKPDVYKDLYEGMTFTLKEDACYASGKLIPSWVHNRTLYIRQLRADGKVVFSILASGPITGTINRDVIII